MYEVVDFSGCYVPVREEADAVASAIDRTAWVDYAWTTGAIKRSRGRDVGYVDSCDANGCPAKIVDRNIETYTAEVLGSGVCRD